MADLEGTALMRWQELPGSTNIQTGPQVPRGQVLTRPGLLPQYPGSPQSVQPTDFPGVPPRPQFQRQRQPIPFRGPDLATLVQMGIRAPPNQWAQRNLPAQLPTTPLEDPSAAPDPSIVAHIRAARAAQMKQYLPNLPSPMPPGGNPLVDDSVPGTTLNSVPWGQ